MDLCWQSEVRALWSLLIAWGFLQLSLGTALPYTGSVLKWETELQGGKRIDGVRARSVTERFQRAPACPEPQISEVLSLKSNITGFLTFHSHMYSWDHLAWVFATGAAWGGSTLLRLSPNLVLEVRNPPAVQEMQEEWVWSLGREGPLEEDGNPCQYSCLENLMDKEFGRATVHGVTKSWTWLSAHEHTHTHTHTQSIPLQILLSHFFCLSCFLYSFCFYLLLYWPGFLWFLFFF